MQRIFLLLPLVVLLSILAPFSSSTTEAADDLIVGVSEVNLRSGPGLSYDVIASLPRDEVLTSLQRQGDWIQVSTGGRKGWVASWLVVANTNKSSDTSSTKNGTQIAVSQVDNLNIRADADISSSVLG
ncbi:SH3 domain-containing protein [Caryophanon latum]|uniref:SH3 domain-containing protein n=1 Tax=Caryophanon latum TaxID=33977 RepID=UPI000A0031EE|nr:SH3 domain-containing protein [Caryophanon latum]